jgi:cell division cycle 2-like
MSTTSGPPTPSRKRSKWDEDDDDDEAFRLRQQILAKRRTKSKSAKSNDVAPTRRLETSDPPAVPPPTRPLHSLYVPPRTYHPPIAPSRSVYCYERLNQIEEGSYGVVFRARDKQTGDIVALKKLKLDEEKHGFPITALREVNALMSCRHDNVVGIREVVVGDTLTQYVFYILVSLSQPVNQD